MKKKKCTPMKCETYNIHHGGGHPDKGKDGICPDCGGELLK